MTAPSRRCRKMMLLAGFCSGSLLRAQMPSDEGFRATFQEHTVRVGSTPFHYVEGGHGSPVVLLHDFPETWYAWRNVMPILAREHTVIAVDLPGIGVGELPHTPSDTAAISDLMGIWLSQTSRPSRTAVLGHEREYMTEGFFRPLAAHAGAFSQHDLDMYIQAYSVAGVLHSAFEWYRAFDIDIAQNRVQLSTPLPMPVLMMGGDSSWGRSWQRLRRRLLVTVFFSLFRTAVTGSLMNSQRWLEPNCETSSPQ